MLSQVRAGVCRGLLKGSVPRAAVAALLAASAGFLPASAQNILPNPNLPNPAASSPQPWPDVFSPDAGCTGPYNAGSTCWVEVLLYGDKPTFEVVTDIDQHNLTPYANPDGSWDVGSAMMGSSNNPDGRFHQLFSCDPDVHESVGTAPAPCQTFVGLDSAAGSLPRPGDSEQVTMNFGHAGTWASPIRAEGAGCAAVQSVADDTRNAETNAANGNASQWSLSCTFRWAGASGSVISVYYRGAQYVGCTDDTYKTSPNIDHFYNGIDFPTANTARPPVVTGKACKDFPPDDPLAHQEG